MFVMKDSDSKAPWRVNTRSRVQALLGEGMSQAQIAVELGIVKSTVTYHVRHLGHEPDERFNRRYDWSAVQRMYDLGYTITDLQERFGFARRTVLKAARRGKLTTRAHCMPIEELLSAPRGRQHLKLRLTAAGLLGDRCERCGIKEWHGFPLSLALHHRNGHRDDNRLENLELLCPNCHSQTDNFSGRNRRGRLRRPARLQPASRPAQSP